MDLDASKLTCSNSNVGIWKCFNCCEEFKSPISAMVTSYNNGNLGCPYCSGKKVNHKNNLLVTHPIIASEWDYVKNNKSPKDFTAGSGCRTKVWWICRVNPKHNWRASINGRTGTSNKGGSGCPYCSHRISKVETEWLDHLKVDEKYRQRTIMINGKKFLTDAYNSETNTIYEFWGDYYHGNPKKYKSNDLNQICKKTFGELYLNTIKKQEIFINAGYNLVMIWEDEWINIKKDINKIE